MPVNFLRNDSFDSKGKIEVWFNRLLISNLSNTVCYVLKEGILTFNAVINFVSASLPLVSDVWVWDSTVLVLSVVVEVYQVDR